MQRAGEIAVWIGTAVAVTGAAALLAATRIGLVVW